MLRKDGQRVAHQLVEQIAARTTRIVVQNRLVGQVVRRRGSGVGGKGDRLLRCPHDQQVAVADARVELEPAASHLFLQRAQQRGGVFAGNVAGGEVAHHLLLDGHQVAPHGPVGRPEFDPLRRRFERRAAGVVLVRVVAQEAEVGHVGARRQIVGHVHGSADDALGRHGVHGRHVSRLQRRAPRQGVLRFVGTAVGDDDGVFHSVLSRVLAF